MEEIIEISNEISQIGGLSKAISMAKSVAPGLANSPMIKEGLKNVKSVVSNKSQSKTKSKGLSVNPSFIGKSLAVITSLFNDKSWSEQNLFVKAVVFGILICIFPAIPLFFLMALLLKILYIIFYWTRAL